MRFSDKLVSAFPSSMQLPDPLVRYFRWLDEQGKFAGENTAALGDASQPWSCVQVMPPDVEETQGWLGSKEQASTDRLAVFCRTGGDGSRAGLWRDDQGALQFVHLGSGSGSCAVGIMVRSAIDFLRLLAIGYEELCWPEHYELTPLEVFTDVYGDEDEWDDDLQPPRLPTALSLWLEQEFGVAVPATAQELICNMPDYADEPSQDPFYQWLDEVRGMDGAS